MGNVEKGFNAFLGGLILIAVAAVLVKKGAQTPAVLEQAGGALSQSLGAAEGNS